MGEICARLDGIPLAIELAAARTRSMTPAEIAGMLDRRFALLGGTRRTGAGRHQTLKQAVDWSYDLLDPAQRDLFDRLGIFAGTFDVAAVMAVADVDELTARAGLDALVDRCLVEADPTGATTRYRLLETLRQYAHDRLAESRLRLEETSSRHASRYADTGRVRVRGHPQSPTRPTGYSGSTPTWRTTGPRSTGPCRPGSPTWRCGYSPACSTRLGSGNATRCWPGPPRR